ncbi:MAG: PAS domain S-box protein [Anaerolineae bacterium]|nr:PAS domain S-box protein [Anaerolineae bacterium]
MDDKDKTKAQLLRELEGMRRRVAELEATGAYYRLLTEYAGDMICLHKPDGAYLYVSPSCTALLGYEPEELIGTDPYRLFHPDDIEFIRSDSHHKALEGNIIKAITYRIRTKTGSYKWVETYTQPIVNEEKTATHLVTATHDITERKRIENRLRESEERYRDIVELVPEGIVTANLRGVVTSCNSVFTKLTGFSQDEIVGKHFSRLPTLRLKDIPGYIRLFIAILRGKVSEPIKFRWVRKDGALRWGEAYVRLLAEEGGKTTGILMVLRDITEARQAEEALRESEERYRQLVELSPDMIAIHQDGDIRFINRAGAWMLGASAPEELIGRSIQEFVNPEKPALSRQTVHDLLQNGGYPPLCERKLTRLDGQELDVEVLEIPFSDQNGTVIQLIARNVTERRRAERELVRAQILLQSVIEQSPIPMAIAAPDGTLEIFNDACREQLGIDETLSIQPGVNFLDIDRTWMDFDLDGAAVSTDELPLILALQGKTTSGREMKVVRKDGTERWEIVYSVPIYDKNGNLIAGFIVFPDITERKQAEDALRDSQEQLALIIDNIPALLGYVDSKQRYLYVNRAYADWYGYTKEELVGKHLKDVLPEKSYKGAVQHIQAVLQGQTISFENVAYNPNGQLSAVRASYVPHFNNEGVVDAFVGLVEDITERKQAEEDRARLMAQIQEHARQVQQIVDTVPEGVLLIDAGQRIVLTNPAARRDLLVLTDAEVGDKLTHLGTRPLEEFLTSPPKGLWHEIEIHGDAPRTFELIARPIETGPSSGGWVLVIRDVTHEREVQRYVQQQNRLAAVGQLAAGIAHDFNNIMAVIVLYTQIVQRVADLPPKAQDRLETIAQQARRATNLIEQILDFSRRSIIKRQPLNLVPFVKEQVKLLERTLPENIKIDLAYGMSDYVVNADPTRIQQAIMNLAVNARDAMPEGGKLQIEIARIRVDVEAPPLPGMEPGEWVRVSVSDTGTGIAHDALPRIFEPFFTTKAPGGTGLGLAQVYGIVKQHEGYIDIATQIGEGTTFILYLPALSALTGASPAFETPALVEGDGQTILVVEDDQVTRKALVDSLEWMGYRTLTAENGQAALSVWEQHGDKVAMVLSDVVMPEMGGVALFHELKQRDALVKVVLLTGHLLEDQLGGELERLRTQGLMGWLQKPPSLEQLAKTIAQTLSLTP